MRDFVGDVRDERFEEAYSHMSSQYRATVPLDEFTRTVRGNPYFFRPKALDTYKITSSGTTTLADAVLETTSGTYRMFVYFTNEAGGLRLTGLSVGGSEVLPRFAASRPAPSSSAKKPGSL